MIARNANPDTSSLLQSVRRGDSGAADLLLPLVYDELRALAGAYLSRERPDHTLDATALVHEAYVRLAGECKIDWQSRAHFFAIAARAMRQVLVNYARTKNAQKRGGGARAVTLEDALALFEKPAINLLALDEALTALETQDETLARVVEYRFFGGMTVEETAEALGLSERTVRRAWATARARLHRELWMDPS